MMGATNLIPAARLARRRRKARMCWWAGVCGSYIMLLAGGSVTLHSLYAGEDGTVSEELAAVTEDTEKDNRRMVTLRGELAQTLLTLETSRAVHNQPDWSRLLLGLSDKLGEEIVLTCCRLVAVADDGSVVSELSGSSGPTKPLAEFLTECRYRLVLHGFGRTQESVSRLALRLEEDRMFDTVRLISSCRKPFLSGDAVAFTVECRF